ncbi:GNAT family N-acetyltransferase [Aquimarina aquimarini]|uniref:GNAT family N-acetyltransferase n=1 Tax=Aquimarina aquimarini TaxID=1191734 RepID=UPI000D5598A2|nr:GNAT family N-acetyltransferase [Aquimarina aquimarini]
MTIRYAKEIDIEQIIELCEAHALYEKTDFEKGNKKEALFEHLFGAQKSLQCLVVEQNNKLQGYATFMKQFSTWDAEFYIYLDCLYLKDATRGKGIGKQIMSIIYKHAIAEKCSIVQWQTPNFNTGAIHFYKKIGATSKSKERFFWSTYKN